MTPGFQYGHGFAETAEMKMEDIEDVLRIVDADEYCCFFG